MRISPFISLDYPLSCEHLDHCVGGRDKSVEDMIMDPCGAAHHIDRYIIDWFNFSAFARSRLIYNSTTLYWAK